MTNPIIMPVEIDDVSLAFPADALDYMPAWDDIPDDFKEGTGDAKQWCDFAGTWFYFGLDRHCTGWIGVELDDGSRIPGEQIHRQIRAILGSFAPKHEHKMAAVAYLMSLWMDAAAYAPADGGTEKMKVIGDFPLEEWIETLQPQESEDV